MPDREHDDTKLDPTQQTRDWIELKIASMRSEMRMLFVLSVAGNQVLAHLSLTPVLSYVGGGAVFLGAIVAKLISVSRFL